MTRRPVAKAKGIRGTWYAEVNGEKLPCIHDKNMKDGEYRAPNADDDRHRKLLNDIVRTGRVVMRKSVREDDSQPWTAIGYVAVWSVADAKIENGMLTFRFVDRLIDLKD
ncbi:MAG: hypothetical protein JNN10_03795 [Sphingopyxis sp.]|uniref:hypothetical protein n=1 Tax=Sphingopyxis sp. TaxID=1908224 RepID=UPI001A39959F|nr:hypothetical protein [Sphingopyxis sp.]MBL9065398.1 hypothetical protein [Sphingopyxis sp.]